MNHSTNTASAASLNSVLSDFTHNPHKNRSPNKFSCFQSLINSHFTQDNDILKYSTSQARLRANDNKYINLKSPIIAKPNPFHESSSSTLAANLQQKLSLNHAMKASASLPNLLSNRSTVHATNRNITAKSSQRHFISNRQERGEESKEASSAALNDFADLSLPEQGERIARIEANNKAGLAWLSSYNHQSHLKQLSKRPRRISMANRSVSSTERVMKIIQNQRLETQREELMALRLKLKQEKKKNKTENKENPEESDASSDEELSNANLSKIINNAANGVNGQNNSNTSSKIGPSAKALDTLPSSPLFPSTILASCPAHLSPLSPAKNVGLFSGGAENSSSEDEEEKLDENKVAQGFYFSRQFAAFSAIRRAKLGYFEQERKALERARLKEIRRRNKQRSQGEIARNSVKIAANPVPYEGENHNNNSVPPENYNSPAGNNDFFPYKSVEPVWLTERRDFQELTRHKNVILPLNSLEKSLEARSSYDDRAIYNYLVQFEWFSKFVEFSSAETLLSLMKGINLVNFNENNIIYREGEIGNCLYFIVQGSVIEAAEKLHQRRRSSLFGGASAAAQAAAATLAHNNSVNNSGASSASATALGEISSVVNYNQRRRLSSASSASETSKMAKSRGNSAASSSNQPSNSFLVPTAASISNILLDMREISAVAASKKEEKLTLAAEKRAGYRKEYKSQQIFGIRAELDNLHLKHALSEVKSQQIHSLRAGRGRQLWLNLKEMLNLTRNFNLSVVLALTDNKIRNFTAKSAVNSTLLTINYADYDKNMRIYTENQAKIIVELLKTNDFFKKFKQKNLVRLAKCAAKKIYKKGEFVVKEGETLKGIYLNSTGKLAISKSATVVSYYRLPVGNNQWELRTTLTKKSFKLSNKGESSQIFNEELLCGCSRSDYSIRAVEESSLFFIPQNFLHLLLSARFIQSTADFVVNKRAHVVAEINNLLRGRQEKDIHAIKVNLVDAEDYEQHKNGGSSPSNSNSSKKRSNMNNNHDNGNNGWIIKSPHDEGNTTRLLAKSLSSAALKTSRPLIYNNSHASTSNLPTADMFQKGGKLDLEVLFQNFNLYPSDNGSNSTK
jgi:CRP-like cAMP-binding protein